MGNNGNQGNLVDRTPHWLALFQRLSLFICVLLTFLVSERLALDVGGEYGIMVSGLKNTDGGIDGIKIRAKANHLPGLPHPLCLDCRRAVILLHQRTSAA